MKRYYISYAKARQCILVLICLLLSWDMAAQQAKTEQSQKTFINTPERLLANARTQYDRGAYITAEATLKTLDKKILSQSQIAEVERLTACIAYQKDPISALPILQAFLDKWSDVPDQYYMKALLLGSYYANGDFVSAINLMNSINPDKLGEKDLQQLLLNYAMSLIGLGENDEARIQLSTVSFINDNFKDEVTFAESYIDYSESKYDKAIEGFSSVMEDMRFRSRALYFSAQSALEAGDYANAEQFARLYLGEFPTKEYAVDACRIVGEALYAQADYEKAAPTLELYLNECDSPSREALLKLGLSEYSMGAYLRAPEILAMVSNSDDAISQSAYLHSGLSYLKLNDKARARMQLEQAAAMTANDTMREQAMYNCLVCMHETDYSAFGESVAMFERFLNEYPESQYADKANAYLAETYMNTKNYEAALSSINKINHPGPAILEAKQKLLLESGLEAFANGMMEEALSFFTQSLQLSHYDAQTMADAFFWRGETYYRKGAYSKAASDYQQFLSNTSSSKDKTALLALYGLGYCRFRQQNFNDAYTNFNKLVNVSDATQITDCATISDAWSRIGDCFFQARQYTNAEKSYEKAIAVDPSSCDYAVYQKAFSQGLLGNYDAKIETLCYLSDHFPKSDYVDDAMFEKGRSYVQLENKAKALEAFQDLLTKCPTSNFAPSAGNEIALLYYQNGNVHEAIDAYKKVITNYPGSEQANVAMRDLKSLYVEENMVDSYMDFASQTGGMVTVEAAERDSLTYAAAEQAYMRGEIQAASDGFSHYLQQFENGAYTLNAHYRLGCIYISQEQYENALTHLKEVTARKNSTYCEDATLRVADMAYAHGDYTLAASYYKDLIAITSRTDTRIHAQSFFVRSAYKIGDEDGVINETNTFIDDSKLAPETAIEMRYYRAKCCLKQKQNTQAKSDLKILAKDTRNVYGAESKYLLAQLYYDTQQLDLSEKEVLDYINVSTPHSYWLARSFILLADVYIYSDRKIEAKQYLLSLRQNYSADDDIASMIESRLTKLD